MYILEKEISKYAFSQCHVKYRKILIQKGVVFVFFSKLLNCRENKGILVIVQNNTVYLNRGDNS